MNLKEIKKKDAKFPNLSTQPRKRESLSNIKTSNLTFNLNEERKPVRNFSDKPKKKMGKLPKFFLIGFLILLVIGGSAFGFYYYQNYSVLKNTGVENVSILDPINYAISAAAPQKEQPLSSLEKTDNRTNFLLLGVDARRGFSSYRTDSIIVASYDHETKDVVEFSIPRDMQAKYNRSYTKVNAVFQFSYNEAKNRGLSDDDAVKESFGKLSGAINEITGLNIHYGIMINFTALKDIVDALGGITVNVDKPLVDTGFPNDTDTGLITIRFNAGEQTMNGTRALQYARSRHSTSDYDRARRQQIVVNAIKDKFLKSSLFTDVNAINKILEAVSKNVRFFNVSSSVITEVIKGREVLNTVSISNVVLDPNIGSFTNQVLQGGQPIEGAGFLVYPVNGKYDDLNEIVKMYLNNPVLLKEDANVRTVITNQSRSKELSSFNKVILDNHLPFVGITSLIRITVPKTTVTTTTTPTPSNTVKTVNIYLNGEKPGTLAFYQSLLKSQNIESVVKPKEDLPKELEKHFNDSNILIQFN